MAFAAVPNYLGEDFSTAAPGHRFYLYFKGWEKDHAGNIKKVKDKKPAVKNSLPLYTNDKKAMAALAERQRLLAGDDVWQLPAQTVAPLTTGLGMEHPLENGFAFLTPYGLPYLPGSGIKGVLRTAARELIDDNPTTGWNNETIDTLFGPDIDPDVYDVKHRRGALIFWDAYPVVAQSLITEVMTPHQAEYYQGTAPPHDSGSPNPILFLAIPPRTPLTFYVDCNRGLLTNTLHENNAWQDLLREAFEYAFEWLGFGAKTAVGYGHIAIDTEAEQERAEKQAAREAAQQEQERLEAAVQGLPDDAADLTRRRELSSNWANNGVFLAEMESWLEELGSVALSQDAWRIISDEMSAHFKGDILADPEATQGKKKKPKYSDRQKTLAYRLLKLKPEGKSS